MGIFNLTSLSVNTSERTGTYNKGATVSGTQNDSKYNSSILRYPEDVGSMDKGHYMVIHINAQEHTNKKFGTEFTSDEPTIIENRKLFGSSSISTDLDKVAKSQVGQAVGGVLKDAMNFGVNGINSLKSDTKPGSVSNTGLDVLGAGVASGGQLVEAMIKNGTNIAGIRTIKRTTDTIALYMPDTLNFVHNQGYSDLSVTGIPAAAISAGASLADSLKSGANAGQISSAFVKNVLPYAASLMTEGNNFGQYFFTAASGLVRNPMLELMYTTPSFRTFRFDFMFYPRSEKEGKEVYDILQKLKFHQAPELRPNLGSFFLIPPSEFDIKFYYNGRINRNIPALSTCVLETLDIDYAPNGFAAYEVPGESSPTKGRTGAPVAFRVGLQFKETEILTKDNFVEQGAWSNFQSEMPGVKGK